MRHGLHVGPLSFSSCNQPKAPYRGPRLRRRHSAAVRAPDGPVTRHVAPPQTGQGSASVANRHAAGGAGSRWTTRDNPRTPGPQRFPTGLYRLYRILRMGEYSIPLGTTHEPRDHGNHSLTSRTGTGAFIKAPCPTGYGQLSDACPTGLSDCPESYVWGVSLQGLYPPKGAVGTPVRLVCTDCTESYAWGVYLLYTGPCPD